MRPHVRTKNSHIHFPFTTQSYVKYAEAGAQALRNGLKEELRVAAQRRSENSLKYARWQDGKIAENSTFSVYCGLYFYVMAGAHGAWCRVHRAAQGVNGRAEYMGCAVHLATSARGCARTETSKLESARS